MGQLDFEKSKLEFPAGAELARLRKEEIIRENE